MKIIPNNIHLIWFGSALCARHRIRLQEWQHLNPQHTIHLWTSLQMNGKENYDDIVRFCHENTPFIQVHNVDDELSISPIVCEWLKNASIQQTSSRPNYAALSDIYRFYILNQLGGWYFDTDIEPWAPLPINLGTIHGFALDINFDTSSFRYSPGILCTIPNSLFTQMGIQLIERMIETHSIEIQQAVNNPIDAEKYVATHYTTGEIAFAALTHLTGASGKPIIDRNREHADHAVWPELSTDFYLKIEACDLIRIPNSDSLSVDKAIQISQSYFSLILHRNGLFLLRKGAEISSGFALSGLEKREFESISEAIVDKTLLKTAHSTNYKDVWFSPEEAARLHTALLPAHRDLSTKIIVDKRIEALDCNIIKLSKHPDELSHAELKALIPVYMLFDDTIFYSDFLTSSSQCLTARHLAEMSAIFPVELDIAIPADLSMLNQINSLIQLERADNDPFYDQITFLSEYFDAYHLVDCTTETRVTASVEDSESIAHSAPFQLFSNLYETEWLPKNEQSDELKKGYWHHPEMKALAINTKNTFYRSIEGVKPKSLLSATLFQRISHHCSTFFHFESTPKQGSTEDTKTIQNTNSRQGHK